MPLHEGHYRDKALDALSEISEDVELGTIEQRIQAADMLLKATEPDWFSTMPPLKKLNWYDISIIDLTKFFLKATTALFPAVIFAWSVFVVGTLLITSLLKLVI